MDIPEPARFEALSKVAQSATRDWKPARAALALRAAGLDQRYERRDSLDAIAADTGVSRETVRRARKDLLAVLQTSSDQGETQLGLPLSPRAAGPVATTSIATTRALRRLLTLTGPLAWDEVLSAWARAGGKEPHLALPTDIDAVITWLNRLDGLVVTKRAPDDGGVTVAVQRPEPLDRVSSFFFSSLRSETGGLERGILLEQAEHADLKATTVANALSHHPAIVRVGRGSWALRRSRDAQRPAQSQAPRLRKLPRSRPTSFSWSDDGLLVIEFTVPRGPSPVIAVPRAVANLVEGREFQVVSEDRSDVVKVRNSRLWGFRPIVSEQGLNSGTRARMSVNLLDGTATMGSMSGKETSA